MSLVEFDSLTECPYNGGSAENPVPWVIASKWGGSSVTEGDLWQVPASEVREYSPLDVPGLHRIFAALDGTDESFVGFARRYGFLGRNTWSLVDASDGQRSFGESCIEWRTELLSMKMLVKLYDVWRDPRSSDGDLGKLVQVLDGEVQIQYREEHGDIHDFFAAAGMPVQLRPVPDGIAGESTVRRGAKALMRGLVSERLAQETKPTFDLGPGGQLKLAPKTLLGAMYVQLAEELMGKSDPLVRCASCGRWFPSHHAGKMYCGSACKMKAYRRSLKNSESDANRSGGSEEQV